MIGDGERNAIGIRVASLVSRVHEGWEEASMGRDAEETTYGEEDCDPRTSFGGMAAYCDYVRLLGGAMI